MQSEKFSKPITDIIRERTSWRTYTGDLFDDAHLGKINSIISDKENIVGPFGGTARFKLISVPEYDKMEKKQLGTYGFISGAPYFIAGAISKTPKNLEDYGYLLEKIILHLTDMGLGTCWLGGTFNKTGFAKKISLLPNEVMPAITPVGFTPKRRGLKGGVIRLFVGAKKRKSFETLFFKTNFEHPIFYSESEPFAVPLEMVRLGPSAKNGQSWRIVIDFQKEILHFFVQKEKNNKLKDKVPGFQRLDTGIAMCHFNLTCEEIGISGKWFEEDPHLETTSSERVYIMSWQKIT